MSSIIVLLFPSLAACLVHRNMWQSMARQRPKEYDRFEALGTLWMKISHDSNACCKRLDSSVKTRPDIHEHRKLHLHLSSSILIPFGSDLCAFVFRYSRATKKYTGRSHRPRFSYLPLELPTARTTKPPSGVKVDQKGMTVYPEAPGT